MIGISEYRSRIGTFSSNRRDKTTKFKKFYTCEQSEDGRSGQAVLVSLNILVKVILIFSLLQPSFGQHNLTPDPTS